MMRECRLHENAATFWFYKHNTKTGQQVYKTSLTYDEVFKKLSETLITRVDYQEECQENENYQPPFPGKNFGAEEYL